MWGRGLDGSLIALRTPHSPDPVVSTELESLCVVPRKTRHEFAPTEFAAQQGRVRCAANALIPSTPKEPLIPSRFDRFFTCNFFKNFFRDPSHT